MKLFASFRKAQDKKAAIELYAALVKQAREPYFYLNCGAPDTLEGRFDMVALHAFLIMRRLKQECGQAQTLAKDLSQRLFDVMFAGIDSSLRESGVSDLAIGGRVKKLAMAFYGRVAAYDEGLDANDDGHVLALALKRNLFRSQNPDDGAVLIMVEYMRAEAKSLASQPVDSLLAGKVMFGQPPGPLQD